MESGGQDRNNLNNPEEIGPLKIGDDAASLGKIPSDSLKDSQRSL